jgi:fermentation-respiration switch protein FrsA (DUF1100 family)
VTKTPVWKRVLRSAALAVGLVFLLGGAFVMFFEEKLIYFPAREELGRGPGEDVFLTTSDGVRIHGWHVTNPDATKTILYFHGNAGHIGDRRGYIEDLRRLPANVFALDYRGYGRSEGKPSEDGLYRDARAAYDWLVQRTPPEKIVVLGKSLGGGPACELASTVPVGGLIAQSAFTSAKDMSRIVMKLFPARWFMRTRYDNLAKVPSIRCPKLFIHGRQDEMIPFRMGEALFAAAAEPKENAWFDRGDHNWLIDANGKAYFDVLRRFLEK